MSSSTAAVPQCGPALISLPPGCRRGSNAGNSVATAVAVVFLGVVLVFLALSPAFAQTAESDTVRNRARPEFAPLGLELDDLAGAVGVLDAKTVHDKSSPLSSFVVFPKLELAGNYESNLFRDNTHQFDKIAVISPGFALRSDWENHALEFAVNADIGRHDRHPTEDYDDVRAILNGRFDLADNVQLNGLAQVGQEHLKRGTLLDDGRTTSAIVYRQSIIGFGGQYTGDRFQVKPQVKVTGEDYLSAAGLSNDDLDRAIVEVKTRVAYEWLPGTALFVEPSFNNRTYRLSRDFNGLLQDSHGYQMLAGVTWDVSGVTFIEFGTGYLRQEFEEPTFGTIEGPALSGRLVWNPLDPITLELRLGRDVQERRGQNQSGVLVTSIKSRVDYEMFYNLILSLTFDYANEADKATPRDDNRFNAGVEARYLVNQNFFAGLLTSYEKLNSNEETFGFRNLVVSLRLGAQL